MKGLNAMGDYITTFTGKHFYPMSPDPMAICIEDIAHALSLICRGNGHVHKFWSVAEHCICCAKEAEARGLSARVILACLLHDAKNVSACFETFPESEHINSTDNIHDKVFYIGIIGCFGCQESNCLVNIFL